jgi:hydrogenase/urease accessory protein HupE
MCTLFCWCLVALLGYAVSAQAHTTSISYADIRLTDQRLAYTLEVSPHDLAVLVGLAGPQDPLVPLDTFVAAQSRLADAMRDGIVVANDGVACPATAFEFDTGSYPDMLRLITSYTCDALPGRLAIVFRLFFNLDPAHKHLGKVQYDDHIETFLLTADRREFTIDVSAASARGSVVPAWHFLRLGVAHILAGYDHLLFLLALLLAGGRLRQLVKIVTAFTLAHSLTLILATLGVVELPARLVESVIALSIIYVAAENFFITQLNRRWIVTFVFGLVHGFGFYGVLRDLQLPQQALVLSLCAFNVGVEVGQVMIVTLCYPALVLLGRQRWRQRVIAALSLVIGALGLYWFVERAFFA